MPDTVNGSDPTLVEREDNVTIVCQWHHAVFLWTQFLTKRRLYFDRDYGDLASLRDALARGREDVFSALLTDGQGNVGDEWLAREPLALRLPREVAVTLAHYLTDAVALPALPLEYAHYDVESPLLFLADVISLAHEVGADWQAQLYLPNPPASHGSTCPKGASPSNR